MLQSTGLMGVSTELPRDLRHLGDIRMLQDIASHQTTKEAQVIGEGDRHKATQRHEAVHGNLQEAVQLKAAGGDEHLSHLEEDQVCHGHKVPEADLQLLQIGTNA